MFDSQKNFSIKWRSQWGTFGGRLLSKNTFILGTFLFRSVNLIKLHVIIKLLSFLLSTKFY